MVAPWAVAPKGPPQRHSILRAAPRRSLGRVLGLVFPPARRRMPPNNRAVIYTNGSMLCWVCGREYVNSIITANVLLKINCKSSAGLLTISELCANGGSLADKTGDWFALDSVYGSLNGDTSQR